jgi:alanyl-tRNA synthetase
MKAQEIRETFLNFFAQRGHKVVKSSPLIPKDDPTILFTNAGMNQFKNVFLGLEKRSYRRAASVQKCMRVSGKHNDLEQVGRTTKHHTFFEMLGNFSFGDYFKKEAIIFAWELMTEVFQFPPEKLYVTIYEEDDEAFRIWREEVDIPPERIFRFGKEDNYWAMGDIGPCGPCSEIHYDLGPDIEEGAPYKLIEQGSDRFLELWNLVFMQFYQDEKGEIHPLPSPSIDTGMGLERMATCLQGKRSNFETDLFMPIIEEVMSLSNEEYPTESDKDISFRIIADHARAISFLIGDGVMPANEGRGYVLRRLIRRAFRHGHQLGLEQPFLYKLVSVVSEIMKDAYPELLDSTHFISQVCLAEEERFSQTLHSGLKTFYLYVEETLKAGKKILPGDKLFKLYDTYGFPLDLSQDLAAEKNLGIDEEGFQRELALQRERARQAWKGDELQREKTIYEPLKDLESEFVGYESTSVPEAKVLAMVKDGQLADELTEGEEGEIILDKTPFYAEAGGQIGDTGYLKNAYFSGQVKNAFYPIPEIIAHQVKVLAGKIRVGDLVEAVINEAQRKNISRNHTATHLLHAALRQTLGEHVKQAGSLVSAERLRFDFTHFAPLSQAQIKHIEELINQKIREDIPVIVKKTTLEEGLKEGAIAIFEEKYGEFVRMICIGDFSKELCGGVHVARTGEIGVFKIISEASVAAGMRRIEAVTGEEAVRYFQEIDDLINRISLTLNTSRKEIILQIGKIKEALKAREKEVQQLRAKVLQTQVSLDKDHIKRVNQIDVYLQLLNDVTQAEMRNLADNLKQKLGSGVVVLGAKMGEKAFVVASVSRDIASQVPANELIQKLARMIEGGGGGRPEFAQAGGKKAAALEKALTSVPQLIEEILKNKNHP